MGIMQIQNQNLCLNLTKIMQITKLMSDFGENEIINLKQMLGSIKDICFCDNIAYVQSDNHINTEEIISVTDTFKQTLLKNDVYKKILKYATSIEEPIVIDNQHVLYKEFEIDNFMIVAPVILKKQLVGVIVISFDIDSINSKLYNNMNLIHFQLVANIIAIQENSYRVKYVLEKSNMFRKILNDLAVDLINTKDENMDEYINLCIQKTCEIWDIDRGYLFAIDFNDRKLYKTNEWCGEGIVSMIDTENEIDFKAFPWNHIIHRFNTIQDPIHIANVEDNIYEISKNINDSVYANTDIVKELQKPLDYILKVKNLKSILLIPIQDINDEQSYTLAILGFSQVLNFKVFSNQLIDLLNILSCYISEAIGRRRKFNNEDFTTKSIIRKIKKWEEEELQNNLIFNSLQEKMKIIFDNHSQHRNLSI